MDGQSTCWRCGEPGDGRAVCDLCGAVPARQRTRIRPASTTEGPARAVEVPEGESAGAAALGTVAPPPLVDLAPPRPEDRVAGLAAPPAPPQARQPRRGRSMLLVRVGLAAVVPIVGIAARVALRDWGSTGDAGQVQRARAAADFSGECVTMLGTRIETVSCDGPHTGQVRFIVDATAACPSSTIDSIAVTSDPTKRLCVMPR